jgi:Protein of unknown function (DUF2490)
MLHKLLLAIFFLSPLLTAAQRTREVQTQNHAWMSLNTQLRLTDKFGISADVHVRRTNFLNTNNFFLVRVGGIYYVNKQLSLGAGHAHMWLANQNEATELFSDENRLHQQIAFNQKAGKVQINQRLRIEERWIQRVINFVPVDQIRYTTRFRYQLTLNIPVSSNPKLPSLALSDELMMQTGKDIIYNNFDQNRLFAGIRQQVSPALAFDFGYMRVWQQRLSGYQYNRNHTIRLFFYWQPDFRKKKTEAAPDLHPLL